MADSHLVPSGGAIGAAGSLTVRAPMRAALFGGLALVAFVNAIFTDAVDAVMRSGAITAVTDLFGISVFVWAALVMGVAFLGRGPAVRADTLDIVAASLALLLTMVPEGDVGWLSIAGLSGYLIIRPRGSDAIRRGAMVLLALTIPPFWARALMSLASDPLLAADAELVSWLVGTTRQGNLVPFADGTGALWIAPDCSSFTNLSLALLAAVMFVQMTSGRWTRRAVGYAVLAGLAVIVINVTRISLIGFYPDYFDLIHGDIGAGLAGWASTLAILGVFLTGYRRHGHATR